MVGLDTGFFVQWVAKHPTAQRVWQRIRDGEVQAVVSVITLFELLSLFLRQNQKRAGEKFIALLSSQVEVVTLTPEIARYAAGLRHGEGFHSLDALTLASLIHGGAQEIYTTDRAWLKFKKRGVQIHHLT